MLLAVGSVGASAQTSPFVDTPPDPSEICPAIDEGYTFCSADLLSGNCREFATAARALSRLYRFNVQREPSHAKKLRDTIWWGCGSADFAGIRDLLVRLDSTDARAVLALEPYRSLPTVKPAAPSKPAPAAPPNVVAADCWNLSTEAERQGCQRRAFEAARAAYQKTVQQCETTLGPPLGDNLASHEKDWQRDLGGQCVGEDSELHCLTQALQERRQAIATNYPACAPAAGRGASDSRSGSPSSP